MPKIGNPVSNEDIPCVRCNSKRKVSKFWIEKIKNDNGFMILEHTQIVCTNRQCQLAFEKVMLEDIQKREKIRLSKLDNTTKKIASKISI